MTILDRTRKLLWGRSGSRCAVCRRELIMPSTPVDDESIIGDECHIVSARPSGPRYDPEYAHKKLDGYANLLLLCKVHHKLIDDQVSEYSVSRLVNNKASHEKWVSEQLGAPGSQKHPLRICRVAKDKPAFLHRIRSGRELLDVVNNACGFALHYDDLRNPKEDDLVSGFLQNAQDWGELEFDSVSEKMRTARFLENELEELERAGFWVFGYREQYMLEGEAGTGTDWPVAHVSVLRDTNPEIMNREDPAIQEETDK